MQKDQKIKLIEESFGKKLQSKDKKIKETEDQIMEVMQDGQKAKEKYE